MTIRAVVEPFMAILSQHRRAAVLLMGMMVLALCCDYQSALNARLPLNNARYFEILPGEGVRDIAERLRSDGLFPARHWLLFEVYRRGIAAQLKHGEYELRPGMRLTDALALFAAGKVYLHSITLLEGWTVRQSIQALQNHLALNHDAALSVGTDLEGRLFPDTYLFPKGTPLATVLNQAQARMQRILYSEWSERAADLPLASADAALILASIVEKETAMPSERPRIAGVFLRRLQRGMKLQTDPSVIYGLGDHFDGNLRRADLERDTPYNTYTRTGLPPTPIAQPGQASIHAVMHPDLKDDSLYFVAKGDGSHVFSATLTEHERAVERYQKHPHTP